MTDQELFTVGLILLALVACYIALIDIQRKRK